MTQHFKYILTFVVLILVTAGLNAKPRSVDLAKELKNASLIEYVEILGYTDTAVVFKSLNYDQTLTAKIPSSIIQVQAVGEYMTSFWPSIGEEVLIVVGKNGFVSLFASKQNDYFRFWSPYFTMSVAIFYFKEPAMKLPNEEGFDEFVKGEHATCWDGCLLPIDKLSTYGQE